MKTGLLVLRGQENQHLSCFPAEQNVVRQRAVYARRKIVCISQMILRSMYKDNIDFTPTRDNSSVVLKK